VRETIESLSDDDGGRAIAAVRSWATGDRGGVKLVVVRQHGSGSSKWLKVEWIEKQFSIDGIRIYLHDSDLVELPIHYGQLYRNWDGRHDSLYFAVGLEKLPSTTELRGGHAVLTRSGHELTDRVVVE
jgi:hypothetical protein